MANKKLPTTTKPQNMAHTTKKVKFVGTETFINAKTGEIEEFQVQDIAERDFNFTKVWMRQFIQTLEMLGNQKTRVALWIIDHINHENQLVCTQQMIAEQAGVARKTVSETMRILKEADFIKRSHSGAYMINADILFKGAHNKRLNIASMYHELGEDAPKLTDAEKADKLRASIKALQAQLAQIEKNLIVDAEVEGQLSLIPDEGGDFRIAQKAK